MSAWSFWKAYAATRTWTGASLSNPNPALRNNLWTNQFNWSGSVLPQAGDDLVFGAAPQPSNNNFPSGTTFNSISIGSGHIMTGSGIALSRGLVATGGQISLASIQLTDTQSFNAPVADVGTLITSDIQMVDHTIDFTGPGNLLMTGQILGAGASVRRQAGGVTVFTNNNLYGDTNVFGGTLIINGSQGTFVKVAGGTFGGGGTVGTLNIETHTGFPSSRINPGNINGGTAILSVGNTTAINAPNVPTVFEFDLKSATVGSGYDQLNVSGTVHRN